MPTKAGLWRPLVGTGTLCRDLYHPWTALKDWGAGSPGFVPTPTLKSRLAPNKLHSTLSLGLLICKIGSSRVYVKMLSEMRQCRQDGASTHKMPHSAQSLLPSQGTEALGRSNIGSWHLAQPPTLCQQLLGQQATRGHPLMEALQLPLPTGLSALAWHKGSWVACLPPTISSRPCTCLSRAPTRLPPVHLSSPTLPMCAHKLLPSS